MGANDGVRRGDRADTGDLEAKPKDGVSQAGSGVRAGGGGTTGHPTADPSSLGGDKPKSRGHVNTAEDDPDVHTDESPA
jgi:hypothetical protein